MDLHVCDIYVETFINIICVWQFTRKILEAYYCSTSKCFVFIPQFLSELRMMFRGTLLGKHWPRPGLIFLAHGIHYCPNSFTSFARPASLYFEAYVYIYAYLIAYRLYVNYRYYRIALRVQYFYTDRELCEMVTGYLSLGRRAGSDWANM